MNQIELYHYAIVGLTTEIDKLDKTIREGYKFIHQIDNGEKPATSLTKSAILDVIEIKCLELKELQSKLFKLKWAESQLEIKETAEEQKALLE